MGWHCRLELSIPKRRPLSAGLPPTLNPARSRPHPTPRRSNPSSSPIDPTPPPIGSHLEPDLGFWCFWVFPCFFAILAQNEILGLREISFRAGSTRLARGCPSPRVHAGGLQAESQFARRPRSSTFGLCWLRGWSVGRDLTSCASWARAGGRRLSFCPCARSGQPGQASHARPAQASLGQPGKPGQPTSQ